MDVRLANDGILRGNNGGFHPQTNLPATPPAQVLDAEHKSVPPLCSGTFKSGVTTEVFDTKTRNSPGPGKVCDRGSALFCAEDAEGGLGVRCAH